MAQSRRNDFWNKKNNKVEIKHKYSKEEYNQKRVDLHQNLKIIKNAIQPYLFNSLKERMINIHLEKLLDAIKYYFTSSAQRVSVNHNTKYKEGAKEIFKFTRFLPNDENIDTVQNAVYENLQIIIQSLKVQIEYIQEIEQIRHEKRQSQLNVNNVY